MSAAPSGVAPAPALTQLCQITSTAVASLLPRSHFSWIHDTTYRCLRNQLLVMVAAAAHPAAASTQQPQVQQQHQPTQQQQPPAGAQQEQPQPQQPVEDKWEVNKPVERRSQVLTEELNDCLGRFWTWVSCGGPAARMRQLYVNGRLSRCWDEYVRFKNCMIGKLNPDQQIAVLPGPHFLWHIRTRKEAAAFWKQHYAHLGAGATNSQQTQQDPGAEVDESKLQPDVTSKSG